MLIGELARSTNTQVETIRYYEREGLLPKPPRTPGNYRSYGTSHLRRLSFIRRARDLGFTLDQVRELIGLADEGDRSCAVVSKIVARHLTRFDHKIRDLHALRSQLVPLVDACASGSIAECRILEALALSRHSAPARPLM